MSNVVATSAEQGSAISDVSQSILAMDQVTQQNDALVEESAAATASLRLWARALTAAMAPFLSGAGGLKRLITPEHPEATNGHLWNALQCADPTPTSEHRMPRPILDETAVHPAIRQAMANLHIDLIRQVQSAVDSHRVVVVGLSGNPFVSKARKALSSAGVPCEYLEFGSYFTGWRRRNALKMWTGWPTFPMVFVRGTLIGGHDDLVRLIASGELKTRLAA